MMSKYHNGNLSETDLISRCRVENLIILALSAPNTAAIATGAPWLLAAEAKMRTHKSC